MPVDFFEKEKKVSKQKHFITVNVPIDSELLRIHNPRHFQHTFQEALGIGYFCRSSTLHLPLTFLLPFFSMYTSVTAHTAVTEYTNVDKLDNQMKLLPHTKEKEKAVEMPENYAHYKCT